jgi:hypothetical protein
LVVVIDAMKLNRLEATNLPELIYLLIIDEITTSPNEPLSVRPRSSDACFEDFLLYIKYCR